MIYGNMLLSRPYEVEKPEEKKTEPTKKPTKKKK